MQVLSAKQLAREAKISAWFPHCKRHYYASRKR